MSLGQVKTIDMRIVDDQMLANREVSINEETERFKAVINVKGRDNVFLMDGGILLLIRYLIVNNYVGVFHYYSMNLMGKLEIEIETLSHLLLLLLLLHLTFFSSRR